MSPRERVRVLVDAPTCQRLIIALIVINAGTLGCETSPQLLADHGPVLRAVDRVVLAVFTVEVAARWYAYGWRFFRDPWNCFDALIIGVALLPVTGAFSVLRSLRVLRVLRLISVIPSMRRVVSALLTAVPGMASIAALLGLILYVGSVIATKLFSTSSPEYFGDLGDSLFTLFQVMTGEAWSEVARDVMMEEPLAWIFFIAYIGITTFTVLNLFIAVAVNAMESQVDQEEQRENVEIDQNVRSLLGEVRELRTEVEHLRSARAESVRRS
ncbi:ion transporter [Parasphingorhabdus pacifica]